MSWSRPASSFVTSTNCRPPSPPPMRSRIAGGSAVAPSRRRRPFASSTRASSIFAQASISPEPADADRRRVADHRAVDVVVDRHLLDRSDGAAHAVSDLRAFERRPRGRRAR
jgi:hypothetical protein